MNLYRFTVTYDDDRGSITTEYGYIMSKDLANASSAIDLHYSSYNSDNKRVTFIIELKITLGEENVVYECQ